MRDPLHSTEMYLMHWYKMVLGSADARTVVSPCRNSVDVAAPWTTTIVYNDSHSLIGARGINISAAVGRVITGSISSSSVMANGLSSLTVTIVINGTAGMLSI